MLQERSFEQVYREVFIKPEPDEVTNLNATIRTLLRRLYDTERRLQERNFAKDHSFEEWLGRELC